LTTQLDEFFGGGSRKKFSPQRPRYLPELPILTSRIDFFSSKKETGERTSEEDTTEYKSTPPVTTGKKILVLKNALYDVDIFLFHSFSFTLVKNPLGV